MPSSAKELSRSRVKTMDLKKTSFWSGKRVWEVPDSDAVAAEYAAVTTSWSASVGILRPRAVTVSPHHQPGLCLITVDYEGYDLSVFSPSQPATIAAVEAKIAGEWEDFTSVALPSGEVDVTGEPDTDGFFYRIIRGPKGWLARKTYLYLNTAIPRGDFDLGDLLEKTGLVSAGYFLGAAPGTVLLAGVEVPKFYLLGASDEVVPLVYTLLYDSKGWPTEVTIQKYRKVVKGEPVVAEVDANGKPTRYFEPDMASSNPADPDGSAPVGTLMRSVARPILAGPTIIHPILDVDSSTFNYLQGLLSWL
jgi:hypothetical protein